MAVGEDGISAAIKNADRGFAVIEGGRGKGKPPAPPDQVAKDCPVRPIGHHEGHFWFLDAVGQKRELTARQLGSRNDLLGLFGFDETWLRAAFPKTVSVKKLDEAKQPVLDDNRKPVMIDVTVDFYLNGAAAFLGRLAVEAGIWGAHIVFRKPGVWKNAADVAVHCGDVVRIGADWQKAGVRVGDVIWAAAARQPRPSTPCDHSIAVKFQDDLQSLFNFAHTGAATALIGLLGTAYLGAAVEWRPNGFIWGTGGSGKSALINVLAACCPMKYYSNDASKAGVEQDIDGIAMPIFLDEAEKTDPNSTTAQQILDMVLTASGGEGTQGVRGGGDGRARKISVVGSFFMTATSPPEMRETHLGRVQIIQVLPPKEGEDHRDAHKALAHKMEKLAPSLWGRALSAFERYNDSLKAFREALNKAGCGPREQDQYGAILAGWWILTHEGAPDSRGCAEGLLALDDLVRTRQAVDRDSNARGMVEHLFSTMIAYDSTTRRAPISALIDAVLTALSTADFGENRIDESVARRALEANGIRVVRGDEKHRGEPVRKGGAGKCPALWINFACRPLKEIFEGSLWAGTRWQTSFMSFRSAAKPKFQVKFAGQPYWPVWISLSDLSEEKDDTMDG